MSQDVTWRAPKPPMTRDKVAKLEHQWGVQLPDDYVECALVNHGGRPTPCYFDFSGRREAVLSHLLGYVDTRQGVDDPSIHQIWASLKGRLPNRVFPFAADPFGNFLCFDYRKAKTRTPTIGFWNHELEEEGEKALTRVCNSFSELLGKLHE